MKNKINHYKEILATRPYFEILNVTEEIIADKVSGLENAHKIS
jgi:hypothetical protein